MRRCADGIIFTNVSGPGYPINWDTKLSDYRNPNWGYMK
jgi:hypothetical protein